MTNDIVETFIGILALHLSCVRGLTVSDVLFFFSSRRRHTSCLSDWSSDVCSSDLRQSPQGIPHYQDGLLRREPALRHEHTVERTAIHPLQRDPHVVAVVAEVEHPH